MKWLIFVAWNLINDVKIFFYSVRPYQMCIKCTWEYAYHNASKSDANVRVLVVSYQTAKIDAHWLKVPVCEYPVRCIVAYAQGCWVVIDFSIILLYFVEIYIHSI